MIFSTGGIKGRTSRGLALALELALLASPAFAAVYTLPTTVTSTAYVDLGAGPLDIGVNSVNGVSIVVADPSSPPSAGAVGNVVLGRADKITFCQTAHIYAKAFDGSATVTATPTSCAGGGGGGSSAITSWAGSTLGAISNYGTSPGAVLVPGVNAYVTNFPSTYQIAGGSATIGNVNQSAATAGYGRITDGTSAAAVKAASTAPAATDPALVVTLSPNGALPAFAATPTVNLGTLNGAATAANQTAPQAATGSAAPANAVQAGAVSSGNLVGIIQADSSASISISTATTTQLVALASGKKIYVTAYDFVAAGTGNITLEYGTGTACATGTTVLTGAYNLTAQAGVAKGGGLGPVLVVPAGNALCALTSAAVQISGSVAYTQF